MRFHFLTSPTLPRLSWCARIDRGEETVRVRCGNWVETTEDSFSEAAWDGEFSRSQPDLALTMTGTAARLSQESITFATSTNLHDRLYFYPEKTASGFRTHSPSCSWKPTTNPISTFRTIPASGSPN